MDPRTLAILDAVAKAASDLSIKWMVAGATGRVMLLEGIYGLPPGRATEDVDLGVMVESWLQYQALVEHIRQDERFQPDPKQRQRLTFRDDGLLDLVPFGGIESSDGMIHWPPDNDFVLTVMGFREAHADVIKVPVAGLTVPVASPVGLVLLKLVAWHERHNTQPRKDAADLAYVLGHFSAIVTVKTLYDEHIDAMETSEYDIDLAASRVLGQKLAVMAAGNTRTFLSALLGRELAQGTDSRLVREVSDNLQGINAERVLSLFESLRAGFGTVGGR